MFDVLSAQGLADGPIIGGVTDSTATIYIRTPYFSRLQVQWSADSTFLSYDSLFVPIIAAEDSSALFTLRPLQAEKAYWFRFRTDSGTILSEKGYVRTFPPAGKSGYYALAFGACQKNPPNDDTIYAVIQKHSPNIFIHLGDWTYPNNDSITETTTNVYARTYDRVQASYRHRYSHPHMRTYMRKNAIAYVYDDCDFVEGNSSSATAQYIRQDGNRLVLADPPFPPQARTNAIRGYDRHFPHYLIEDTSEGIYQSFLLGNIEVFLLDLRSRRSPNNAVFKNTGNPVNPWIFESPVGHTILGAKQKAWLFNRLERSPAKWKILVSSVQFNLAYRNLRDVLLGIQSLAIPGQGSAGFFAAKLVDSWCGFEAEQDQLLNHCRTKNIRNVIVISGDSHTSAIDDGANAGFPELMAANLARENARFLGLINPLYPVAQLWNQGGQGIGNNNYNYTFGLVEVFGDDSCRLRIIDQYDQVVCSYTLRDGFVVNHHSPFLPANDWVIAPNPVQDKLHVLFSGLQPQQAELTLLTPDGHIMAHQNGLFHPSTSVYFPVEGLSRGLYYLKIKSAHTVFARPWIKE